MHETPTIDAALSVALALAAGMIAQSLARHLRLPGIVLLLGAGVALGPDGAGLVLPETLGGGLRILVGYAVAIVLFEGGMNLDWKRLRRQARVIQLLLTVGAAVTAAGGALAARWFMGWDWRLALPFGALVIVTGPTVVGPLLRRIKVKHSVETVLEAEGVLIDAIGAVVAVVTLGVVLSAPGLDLAHGLAGVLGPLGFGLAAGLAGGALIAGLLRGRRVVPEGVENVFTLSLVLALFQVSNTLFEESGLMAVTAAGVVMGNVPTRVQRDLLEFKEQLTILMIGMLFVLLAAEVRVEQVLELGRGGLLTIACLMLVVRPANVLLSTWRSGLAANEKIFLSWLAPRGIVAAAVASLFAQELSAAGVERGEELQALVFGVIACTVLIQGLSGGLLARLLGLRRPAGKGYVILGGNEIGLALGRLLERYGEPELIFLDNNPAHSHAAEEAGFRVAFGNVLEEATLRRARVGDAGACIAALTNEEVNLLFATKAIEDYRCPRVYLALRRDHPTVSPRIVERLGAAILFGRPRDLERWVVRLRRGAAEISTWRLEDRRAAEAALASAPEGPTPPARGDEAFPENLILPLVAVRGGKASPVASEAGFRRGDRLALALFTDKAAEARAWLERHGWHPDDEQPPDDQPPDEQPA